MENITNKTYADLSVGDRACLSRVLTRRDIELFAAMSGDVNPAHLDDAYAETSLFHEVIAHGMWGGSLISTLIGTVLPGPGSIYMSQSFRFHAPLHVGDELTLTVEVREKLEKNRIVLGCEGKNQDGLMIISGEAKILAPTERVSRPRPILPKVEMRSSESALQAKLFAQAKPLKPLFTAVVHPLDEASLRGAVESAEDGLIEPVLIAPEMRLREIASELEIDLGHYTVIDVKHSHEAAAEGVRWVRERGAEAILKGKLHTDEFIAPALSKTTGIRTERRMSHVFALEMDRYHKPLYLTDVALNIRPDLHAKRDIVQNAIDLFTRINGTIPKVAILSAVERVDPNLPSTLDATALCKMAERGQIRGGLLDGPLAMDNAISVESSRTKGIVSQVAGNADILLCPDVESANMLLKQMRYLSGAEGSGLVLGARVPLIVTSRSNDAQTRKGSCAMALVYARTMERSGG